jgi:DNA-binding CsgD family transcriptional regulator
MPHMSRAFDMRLRFDKLARRSDDVVSMIDAIGRGCLLLHGDGRLAHATPRARQLLDDPAGPLHVTRGRLHARDADAERRLRHLFESRKDGAPWLFEPITIDLPARHRLRIVATAFAGGVLASTHAAYVAFVESPGSDHAEAAKAAGRLYGLTPAETDLLQALLAGNSLAEAAKRLSRSLNTVRNQLQIVFAKSDTHRQSELIAKVLSSPRI